MVRNRKEQAQVASQATEQAQKRYKPYILVVEDDAAILEALRLVLEDAGYSVQTSMKNGEVVRQKLQERLPDLLILDILLSGHDGRDVCRYLKSREDTRHVPVVLISAHPGASATAYEAGADDFIPKPFDIDDLLERVERLVKLET